MKKLIGIILALCMLTTMASAATQVTGNATASDLKDMTVTVTYAGLASDAQATLFAYKVADNAALENETSVAYVNPITTPIVGIDQEPVDGTFTFKVADTFRGKIVVKVGGTDATPVTMLVEFKDAGEEMVEVTVYCGDVNGDKKADDSDALLIISSTIGGNKAAGALYSIGDVITVVDGVEIVCGDVNGDKKADDSDALLIISSTIGGNKAAGALYSIGAEIKHLVPKNN